MSEKINKNSSENIKKKRFKQLIVVLFILGNITHIQLKSKHRNLLILCNGSLTLLIHYQK